jgi:hypothetical protein
VLISVAEVAMSIINKLIEQAAVENAPIWPAAARWPRLIQQLYASPTVSLPVGGEILLALSRNRTYGAVDENDQLAGVPVIRTGKGKHRNGRLSSAAILKKLGLPLVPPPEAGETPQASSPMEGGNPRHETGD